MAGVFGDNMVVARDRPIAIWGWATAGEGIELRFTTENGGEPVSVKVKTDSEGAWKGEIPSQDGGVKGEIEIMSVRGEIKRFSNVAVGEVWFCSGQSNMYLQVFQTTGGEEAIMAANDPDLRLASTRGSSATPLATIPLAWKSANPQTVKNFSAVAYYFGHRLRQELGVPVGLIQSAYNATQIESWLPMEVLEKLPSTRELAAAHRKMIEVLGTDPEEKVLAALSKGERKRAPGGYQSPAALYNAMIHPFVGFPISGILWYQGESNATNAKGYGEMFPAFIKALRERWDRPDLPFYFVELAGYKARQTAPVEENDWSELREAQRSVLDLPHTAIVTAVDVGDEQNIHPKDKKTVGDRLALVALGAMRGDEEGSQSPRLTGADFESDRVVLHFHHASGGLKTRDGGAPAGFAVRNADGVWHWAEAQIEGETVVVSAGPARSPVEVRHAWARNPVGLNVVNSAGLPLLPFRIQKTPRSTSQ